MIKTSLSHFYEGLFATLLHFYEGLFATSLHFYEGLSAFGCGESYRRKKRLHVPKAPCNRFVILLITIL